MSGEGNPHSGGIRGFWDKVSGNTAKKAALAEQQRKRLVESQECAQQVRKQLQQATEIDTSITQRLEQQGYPPAGIDVEQETARIADSVKAAEIYGKFASGVILRGKPIIKGENEYDSYGDIDKIGYLKNGLLPHIFLLRQIGVHIIYPSIPPLENKLIEEILQRVPLFSYVNYPDSDDMLIEYNFPQAYRDAWGRSSYRVHVLFILPKEEAYRLISLMRKNPNSAEQFFQKAAPEVDGNPAKNIPGLQRVKSNEVMLLNLRRFNLDSFNPCVDVKTGHPFSDVRTALDIRDGGALKVETLLYKFNMSNHGAQRKKIAAEMEENPNGEVERLKYSQLFGQV